LRKLDADIRHTMGAIVPNRTDVASIQFCHAAYRVATRGTQGAPTRPLRRLNTGFSRTVALLAERWCYKVSRVRTLAAASSGIARELAQHYPGVPVAVTPNGVDASRFHPDPSEREEVRAANRIAETDIIVLFVGGDWYRKGLEIAITAVAETTRLTSAPLFLWVVGRGDRRRFGELARKRGIGDRVRFFGQRPDTERFFKAADVFVFPTLYEAFPLVALEASASGLPIIAARTNGIEELVEGNAGLIVDRTPEAFAAALARLASDAELRKRMGGAALERSREFTWDDSVGGVLRVYQQLVGRP
jgi:UDP-glucose:(heptosyl)LPS alpha-1,3-glucosyltransferase